MNPTGDTMILLLVFTVLGAIIGGIIKYTMLHILCGAAVGAAIAILLQGGDIDIDDFSDFDFD